MGKLTEKVGAFIVSQTDGRHAAHPNYKYIIIADPELPWHTWILLHELELWCRANWDNPHWVKDKSRYTFNWNPHKEWGQEYDKRKRRKAFYLRGDDEYLQFIVRWSGVNEPTV